jgi:phosphate:Na+ symporter
MNYQEVIFGIIGGLAVFIFGMNIMSDGLKNLGSETFKKILNTLTKKRFIALFVGTLITCIIQSSGATSVMVIGFLNAGLLAFEQGVAVMLGADIGTTLTAWIVSTMGISKFSLTTYALPIIAIGFMINFSFKKRKPKMFGQILLGFGLVFLGLGIMSDGVKTLKESQAVMNLFAKFSDNPILGILVGLVITSILNSSSATIAIIQVMAFQGVFGLETALPFMMGADIGSTATAQFASIGGTRLANGLAMANTYFKIFAVILFYPVLTSGLLAYWPRLIIPDHFAGTTGTSTNIMMQIALAHTTYIIICVLIFSTIGWPLLLKLTKRFSLLHKKAEDGTADHIRYLDPLLLKTPSIALEQCLRELGYMTRLSHKNIVAAFTAFVNNDLKNIEKIKQREEEIDTLQHQITMFLVKLSQEDLIDRDRRFIPDLIHCINDAERIGDHAKNLSEFTQVMVENKQEMPIDAKRDLLNYFGLLDKEFNACIDALDTRSPVKIKEALMFEAQVDREFPVMNQNNVDRLEKRETTVQAGIIFLDMITNFEKIGDHLSNIAERIVPAEVES